MLKIIFFAVNLICRQFALTLNSEYHSTTVSGSIGDFSNQNKTISNDYVKQDENLILSSLPKSEPIFASNLAEYPVCDVAFEGTLCLNNLKHIILPDAQPYGLIGHYTFDMVKPLDSSGSKNHAIGNTVAASSFNSKSSSALFRKSHLIIPHSPSHNNINYSVTFWIYLLEDEESKMSAMAHTKTPNWCPIIHKGFSEIDKNQQLLSSQPNISIDPASGRLKVQVSTTDTEPYQNEYLISNFKLKPHNWFHIALVRYEKRLRLYVNGILDSSILTHGISKINMFPFYIGSTPWTQQICDLPILLDELKIYSIPIGRDFIQAEASGALPGIEPSAVFLACVDCTKLQAEESCPELYHLCSRIEMIAGGYQILKHLGLQPNQIVSHVLISDISNSENQDHLTGIGLCCRDTF